MRDQMTRVVSAALRYGPLCYYVTLPVHSARRLKFARREFDIVRGCRFAPETQGSMCMFIHSHRVLTPSLCSRHYYRAADLIRLWRKHQ
jgi:hypothetical protein